MADDALRRLLAYVARARAVAPTQEATFNANVDKLVEAAWAEAEALTDAAERAVAFDEVWRAHKAAGERPPDYPPRRSPAPRPGSMTRLQRAEAAAYYEKINQHKE